MKITVLGARGSMPSEGRDFLEYGGATSCVLVETDEQAIYIDAGSGIVRTPDIGNRKISILLTHPHLDHLLGMPFFPYISEKNRRVDLYAGITGGLTAGEQMDRLYSVPIWPVKMEEYGSDLRFHDISGSFDIGDVHVESADSVHPGGGLVYKLSCDGHSVVYATDYEYREESIDGLINFCKGCDLLFFDAQYTDEELASRKGYGHSSASQGLKVMEKSGAGRICFVHHDPGHDDAMLRRMEEAVKSETVSFARQGDVFSL
ncbi:MAG: MBL fold metallo-hydrolase [Lachnospiraceae bacterium]|nr:MBL fold metallo-hydrolase [Lachnospiraceae bacterium]